MFNNNAKILSEPVSYQELMSIKNDFEITGIYKIENLINHKVYIGQSVHVIRRLKEHVRYEYNEHLRSSFNEYGFDNFSFEVLKMTYDLDYWEIFLIQIYHSHDRNYGYNICLGGTNGNSGEEWRKRIYDGVMRVLNSSKGKEIRKKISQAKKGKPAFNTGLKWFTNGVINVIREECPENFRPGITNANCISEEEKERRLQLIKENEKLAIKQKKESANRQIQEYNSHESHWYNNGIKNIRAKECPDGYVPGRLGDFSYTEEYKQRKRDYEKNLTLEQRRARSEKLSEAHKGHHFTEERKKHIGDGNRGRKYFNNGEIEVMRYECPPGFVPGRCPKARAAIKSGMNQ